MSNIYDKVFWLLAVNYCIFPKNVDICQGPNTSLDRISTIRYQLLLIFFYMGSIQVLIFCRFLPHVAKINATRLEVNVTNQSKDITKKQLPG